MAARRSACEPPESIDDWAAEHEKSSRGIRERHMERTVGHRFPRAKGFSDGMDAPPDEPEWARGASGQNGFEINLCIVSR